MQKLTFSTSKNFVYAPAAAAAAALSSLSCTLSLFLFHAQIQCDQMTRLFDQSLSIHTIENLPSSIAYYQNKLKILANT